MKEFIEKLIERLKEKFKYNSEQAEIYRDGSDKDVYFREKKDLYMDRANTYGQVMRIVNELAEEYKVGWIPCSERLPEEDEWVLGQGTYDIMITCLTETYKGKQWIDINGDNRAIIAWMPLPAPYKKGE